MYLDTEKWLYSISILVVSIFGSIFPIFISDYLDENKKKYNNILSVCQCFGAGIFLSIALQHLIPDITLLYPPSKTRNYPFVSNMIILGFLLIFLIELIVKYKYNTESINNISQTNYGSQINNKIEIKDYSQININNNIDCEP